MHHHGILSWICLQRKYKNSFITHDTTTILWKYSYNWECAKAAGLKYSTEEFWGILRFIPTHLQTSVILLQEGATMPISRAMSPFRSSNAFSSASSSNFSTPLGSMENSAMLFRYLISANWNMLKYHHHYHRSSIIIIIIVLIIIIISIITWKSAAEATVPSSTIFWVRFLQGKLLVRIAARKLLFIIWKNLQSYTCSGDSLLWPWCLGRLWCPGSRHCVWSSAWCPGWCWWGCSGTFGFLEKRFIRY